MVLLHWKHDIAPKHKFGTTTTTAAALLHSMIIVVFDSAIGQCLTGMIQFMIEYNQLARGRNNFQHALGWLQRIQEYRTTTVKVHPTASIQIEEDGEIAFECDVFVLVVSLTVRTPGVPLTLTGKVAEVVAS